MMKSNKIFILWIMVVLFSCELTKEVDYNTIYEGDKITVHGFVSPQNGVRLIIKKSVSPNRVSDSDTLQNVIVSFYENNNEIMQLDKKDDYLFESPLGFNPDIDKAYSIKIQANGFQEAFSTSQFIFTPVAIDSLELVTEEGTYYQNLVVSFTNTIEFEGSFYLKVYYYLNGSVDSSNVSSEFFNPYGLIDNIVNGKNSIEQQLYDEFDSLNVELYTLSPDLAKFLKSFQDYDSSKEDPFFEQTYPVYSNIENGYGIFASYSVSGKTISKY